MGINVLSLFDGISCGRLALERANIEVSSYYSSEIDKYTIAVADDNYPQDTGNRLGDVKVIDYSKLPKIDLLLAGFPCQAFSMAGKRLNFDDPRGNLFFDLVKAIKILKPEYFLLENVVMKKEWENIISEHLGVQPILINSALISAQNRNRLYWTNIPNITQPKDKGIQLKDITLDFSTLVGRMVGRRINPITNKREDYNKDIPIIQRIEPRLNNKSGTITTVSKDNLVLTDKALAYMNRTVKGGRNHWDFKHHSDINQEKSATVVANFFKGVPYNVLIDNDCIRALHPVEVERLQTIPDNYTAVVSKTQRLKMLGNGWTIDVIAHILKNIK